MIWITPPPKTYNFAPKVYVLYNFPPAKSCDFFPLPQNGHSVPLAPSLAIKFLGIMQERVTGFDVAKCAAIILVVFGHVWRGLYSDGIITDMATYTRVDEMIYLFHMPVIFFLSGMFFASNLAPLAFVKSRIIVLLWPLVLWSIVDGLAKYLAGATHDGQAWTLIQVLIPWQPTTGIFWFLWSLFFLSLLAYLFAQLPRNINLIAMATASAAAIMGLIGAGPFDSLWPVFIHMPEFFAGVALAVLSKRRILLGQHLIWPGIALFIIGQGMLAAGLPDVHFIWAELALATAALGFVLWIGNVRAPDTVLPWLVKLGQLTMPIYLTHILFTAGTRMVLSKIGITDVISHLTIGTLVGIAGPVALYVVVSRLGMATLVGFERPARRAVTPV